MTSTSVIPVRLAEAALEASLLPPSMDPQASYWAGGLTASVVFFASIVAHEAAHAVIAIRTGIAVPRIRLFVFGGVAEIMQEPQAASQEFAITIVGPLASASIGGLFLALAQALPVASVPQVTAQWLGEINLYLAAFNLLPGFPLDGGRVLRSVVWGISGNVHRATRIASIAGAIFGGLLILTGLVLFVGFRASPVQTLWAIFIGWFLWSAARGAYRDAIRRERLSALTVRDMTRAFKEPPISCHTPVTNLETMILKEPAARPWPVADTDGDVFAMVTMRDVAVVPPFLRSETLVGDIAQELEAKDVLEQDTPLEQVLDDAQRRRRAYYFVNAGGRVAGWIFVGDLLRGRSASQSDTFPK